jgi:hypothetical protein
MIAVKMVLMFVIMRMIMARMVMAMLVRVCRWNGWRARIEHDCSYESGAGQWEYEIV